MATPIAALYTRSRSPYLAPSSPPSFASTSSSPPLLPTPPAHDRRSNTKRATLSLDPRRDDPFAAAPSSSSSHTPEGPRVGGGGPALGGEEWGVDDTLDRARYAGPQEQQPPTRREPSTVDEGEDSVRRRSSTSSFFRSLTRPLRTSTSSTTSLAPPSVMTKEPRRSRSSVHLERISAPIPGSARGGSLRVPGKAELISLEEAVERRRSWVAEADEEDRDRALGTLTPEPASTPPLRQSHSARSSSRRSSLGTLLFPEWASAVAAGAQEDARGLHGEQPPTQSRKALWVLGGQVGSTKSEETKAVESDVDESDVVGLALTTDAPTRHIIPDNARYSFATTGSSAGSIRSRALVSTTSSVTSPSVTRVRVASTGTLLSHHAEEEGEELRVQAQHAATIANRPLSPPPTIPLPPLPNESSLSLPRINFTAPTPGTTPASHRSSSRPPLPPGLAPEPVPGSPPSPLPSPRRAPSPATRPSSRASTVRDPPAPSAPSQSASQQPASRAPRPARSSARPASADDARQPHLHFADTPPPKTVRPRASAASTLRSPGASTTAANRAPVSSADVLPHGSKLRSSQRSVPAEEQPRDPLVSLYLVGGLSKDPKNWVEAEQLEGEGKRWKAEVLGVMESGRELGDGEEKVASLDREEKEKVQAKALKLAFDRDVEVVASPSQPPATTVFFSFTTLRPSPAASSSSSTVEQHYHCVSLLVWSHSDDARAAAVASVPQHQRATRAQVEAEAVRRAAKAARAGKRLSSQLLVQMRGEEEGDTDGAPGAASETETEGRPSFDLEDAPAVPTSHIIEHLDDTPMWLPYAIVLVSTKPLYTLLSDVVRLSWARYHQDLAAHSVQMEMLLKTLAPRPGETLRIPVGDEQRETFFVATMPGEIDWSTTITRRRNFPLWPVFKALHVDNLLTVAELALAPLGRIVFLSQHRIMLSLATMAFQTILEMRGWQGLAFPTVHARDYKLFLEDPGPWLLGLPSPRLTSALLSSLSPDIVVVDLDANLVSCARPFPGAVSMGVTRHKARRRLEGATGNVGRNEVPQELTEAFPGGRFRPFSLVEVKGEVRQAERLKPDVAWQWDESLVLKEFDAILADAPRVSVIGRMLRRKALRKSAQLDDNLKQIQAVVRNHATTFVEHRDVLEAEVNKANRRLQILMNQSAEWQRSFQVFKEFSERATHESAELKTRLERERREARRLTGQLAADREHQAQLEENLHAVEWAREEALQELARVDELRRTLEHNRTLVAQAIQVIVDGVEDESNPIYQAVSARIEALSALSETPSNKPSSAHSSRPSSRLARQPSYLTDHYPDSIAEEDEFDDAREVLDEEARLEAMRLAFQETLRAVSSRLSLALQAADEAGLSLDHGPASSQAGSSVGTSSPSRSAESDATLVSSGTHAAFRPPPSPDVGPFEKAHRFSPTGSPALGFQPKRLTLSPPVSPDVDDPAASPVSPFVTVRLQQRRVRAREQAHVKQGSIGGASNLSSSSGTSSSMTPLARSPPPSSAFSTPTSATHAHSRSASRAGPGGWPRSTSAMSLTHSRSASALSQLSYISSPSETDDVQSFVSVSEGGDSSRAETPASLLAPGTSSPNALVNTDDSVLEELVCTVPSAVTPVRRKAHHGRQDSCSIDAPPVALFTRSGSPRSLNGSVHGASRPGAVGAGGGGAPDVRGRVRAVVERYEQRA